MYILSYQFKIDMKYKCATPPKLNSHTNVGNKKEKYSVNENGYYGQFGGAYIPEMLFPNVKELQDNYLKILKEEDFQKEYQELLRDYVGRPTPLFFAASLSEKYGVSIFLNEKIFAIPERIKLIIPSGRYY